MSQTAFNVLGIGTVKLLIPCMALIIGLSQQPTKTPKDKGVPKTASTEVSKQPEAANQNNAPQTLNGDKKEADENMRVQGKLVWFTALLVVVGVLQVGVAFLQWRIYCRQTKLQEIDKRQWAVVENWQLRNKDNFLNDPLTERLSITLDFVNPTNYPLILRDWSYSLGSRKQAGTLGITLPPHSPCSITIPDVVSGLEQNTLFMQDKLVLSVSAKVRFTDVLEKNWQQSFSKMCLCGQHVTEFYRHEFVPDTIEED